MKKEYVKVELKAKNAPSGSYAAGCPTYYSQHGGGGRDNADGHGNPENCAKCEVAK